MMAAALLDPALRAPPSLGLPPPRAAMAAASSSLPRGVRVELASKFMGLRVGGRCSHSRRALVERRRVGDARRRAVCEASETTLEVPDVTTDTWQPLVMECDMPVLVEFWAQWCGPCRMIHPVIGELAKEYTGKLKCFKLNTDENPDVATTYKIRSIPTIMMFKNGEQKDAIIGAVPKATLTSSIDKLV